jgi:hypothetical protein
MKKFEKTYIGKGKQIGNLQIVRISCKIADLVKLAHNYNGEDYITFEVAKLQNPDNFGHSHTAYVNKMTEVQEPAPSQANDAPKKLRKSRKPVLTEPDDLPF